MVACTSVTVILGIIVIVVIMFALDILVAIVRILARDTMAFFQMFSWLPCHETKTCHKCDLEQTSWILRTYCLP